MTDSALTVKFWVFGRLDHVPLVASWAGSKFPHCLRTLRPSQFKNQLYFCIVVFSSAEACIMNSNNYHVWDSGSRDTRTALRRRVVLWPPETGLTFSLQHRWQNLPMFLRQALLCYLGPRNTTGVYPCPEKQLNRFHCPPHFQVHFLSKWNLKVFNSSTVFRFKARSKVLHFCVIVNKIIVFRPSSSMSILRRLFLGEPRLHSDLARDFLFFLTIEVSSTTEAWVVPICQHRDFNVVFSLDRRFSVVVPLDLALPDSVLLSHFVIIMGICISRVAVAVQFLSLGDSLVFVLNLGVEFLSLPLGGLVVSFSPMEVSLDHKINLSVITDRCYQMVIW